MTTGVDMIILSGAALVAIGLWLVARTTRAHGRHRAEPEYMKLRPAHARRHPAKRTGNLDPARPHRLVAQDAALSRR